MPDENDIEKILAIDKHLNLIKIIAIHHFDQKETSIISEYISNLIPLEDN
jgi:hypothetical protein